MPLPKIRRLSAAFAMALTIAGAIGMLRVASAGQRATVPLPLSTGDVRGQSRTELPDGRWLVLGGETTGGIVGSAAVIDPTTGAASPLAGSLVVPRTEHTSTVMADGSVLIVGGRNGNGVVQTAERFDTATSTFTPVSIVGSVPRASHTATLLLDGRILVVGGAPGGAVPAPTELWDLRTQSATPLPGATVVRGGHTATLLADGRVRIAGGRAADGRLSDAFMIVDIATMSAAPETITPAPVDAAPTVAATTPAPGSLDVPLDTRIAVRFSEAVRIAMLTPETIELTGPNGELATFVVGAEGGRLAFVWPLDQLEAGATYTLAVRGATGAGGLPVVPASVSFTTIERRSTSDGPDEEAWMPTSASVRNGWRTDRPPSPWEALSPLTAPPGVTAIAGRVLTLDGRPLPRVTLAMEGAGETQSDRTGRFLLTAPSVGAGRHVLEIEGETASRPGRQYGFFEYGMTIVPGQTNVLPFTIWMPKLDTRHAVRIPSPTTNEVVVTTPFIPGLELHLPPQTVIRGEDGQPVTEITLTPIPVDRPPFPLARNVDVPVYFTVQPGGAYVSTYGPGLKGAWLVYPNYHDAVPGQPVQFFHYDPDVKDWHVYGLGTVAGHAAQVVPDPTTRIYAFTGAMINDGQPPPVTGQNGPPCCDPIDPSTGVFVMRKTDLYLPDVIPLALTRTYNSGDAYARAFGRGMVNPYAMFLWSANQYQEADLILPEGKRIHYVRTSPGTGWTDAVFEHTTSPTRFYKSTIVWNGQGWNLTLTDGTVYVMGENAPLQAIRDRYGNTVTVSHASGQTGNVTAVASPNGRWITFTYDGSNRITQAADNTGRTVSYTYDGNGNLSTVTDPENNVTTYTWTAGNQLATIRDGRNIVYLTNTYTNGRVTQQTLADGTSTYQLSYTVDGSGNITQTDITNPRGHVERLAFNGGHYITSQTDAYGTALARTTTTERQSGTHLVTASVDGLNRRTEYTYNGAGYVLTETRLAGTGDAVTTTYTYEPKFFQTASVTDPLNHTWTLSYDTSGKMTGITDPLSHQTVIAMNSAGLVTSVTDALNHSWQFGYTGGDLTSATDPLNAVATRFVDAAGRVVQATDPLGRITRTVADKLNRVTAITDPLGGQTAFSYDANSNLLSLTDALSHATSYSYDTFDRVATRTDPLTHAASYQYDSNDNLTQATDRKSQVTGYSYDALDRVSQVTFHDSSTITYTYDAGNRVTQIVDSANGTISRQYDGLDRLTQETTSQGTVDYTYDSDGRRSTMTVAGQAQVNYAYDNTHRLTSITQGNDVVAFTYDNADRRSTLTYPNGIVATYGYDSANQLTSLTYTLGQTTLGDLTYTYDASGNRTSVGGSWKRTGIPATLASATYDAANRITSWGGASFTYDLNGNLTSDGVATYTWNARNQLTGFSGGVSASFTYDGLSRRRGKTISGSTTNFLYDGLNFVQEQASGGTPTANLLTGLGIDEVFRRTDAGGARDLLTDALGGTLELADTSGMLQTHYTFEPFGATTVSGSSSTNAAQFTGRENDGNGLYYYRARFYNPRLQRFVSEDPLGFDAGDVNLHAYVANEPTQLVDPSGLVAFVPPAGCRPPGRKDPPPAQLLWLLRCSPFVVPDVLILPPPVRPGAPKPPKNFQPPTHPPQLPPTDVPPGYRIRPMPPTRDYPDGYWRIEKLLRDGNWQPVDPITFKPGRPWDTHIPFPPGYKPQ